MLVELHLTTEQRALLEPIVRTTSAQQRNVLFVATASPHNGVWILQVRNLRATLGSKLLQLLKKEKTP